MKKMSEMKKGGMAMPKQHAMPKPMTEATMKKHMGAMKPPPKK